MSEKDDDLLMEGAKRLRQLIQDKNSKASERAQSSETSRTTTKWAQTSSPASTSSLGMDLSQATMEQLLDEIKARYTAVNLKADIKISIEPLEGGFVTKE